MYPANPQTILNKIDVSHLHHSWSAYQNYVHQAQTSPYWKNAEYEGFTLVAQGQSKEYCKKWISYGCDNVKQHPNKQHYAEHQLKSCKVAFCPKCFESWIGRQANRTTRRLSKFLESRKIRKHYKFRHIILSPPNTSKNTPYKNLKKFLDFALKVANIRTCAIVFHPFRFNKDKSVPVFSPHFHLLVYGHVTNTTEFYNKTKWFIKNKGELKTDKDIFSCVRYLLSHAGVRKSTHAVRYLGDISYRKLKVEKEAKISHCPYCELPLRIFFINFTSGHKPPPIDHVGLWDSSCFRPVEDIDNDTKIPFYEMNENNSGYTEHKIYSFEELLHIKMNTPKIAHHKYLMNQLKFKTSINCQTITSFCN